MNPLRFFFYGTLRRGEPAFESFCRGALGVEAASAAGRLYLLPAGYPVLVLADPLPSEPPGPGPGAVVGDAVTFPDPQERAGARPGKGAVAERALTAGAHHPERLLARLDAYEGVRAGEYVRALLPVRLLRSGWVVEAWAYVCPAGRREEVVRRARLIPSGDWKGR